jgi:hypothetical protein
MLMLGALAPLIAYLASRWYAFARVDDATGAPIRRMMAFVLAALLPVLVVGEIVRTSVSAATAPPHRALHSPALAGIRPRPQAHDPDAIDAFDELVIYLEEAQPDDAPVFALQNEPMIYFASGRNHLFEHQALVLFLAGWGLLPESDRDKPAQSVMIERLEATPEAFIITRLDDPTKANFDQSFPRVARYIEEHYDIEKEIGDYRVMRLKW